MARKSEIEKSGIETEKNNEALNEKPKNAAEEVSLIDIVAVLWKKKAMIISTVLIAMVLVVAFSILSIKLPPEKSPLPNRYSPYAQMLINENNNDSGLAGVLNSSGLSSLAKMSGASISKGPAYNALAEYLVTSNTTVDELIEKYNLVERYKIKNHKKSKTRSRVRGCLGCSYDESSGVFAISYTDIDPEFARDVVNTVVNILDRRFQEIGIDKNQLAKTNLEENISNTYKTIEDFQKQIRNIESSVSNVYSSSATPGIAMNIDQIKLELEVQQNIYAQLKTQYELLKVTMASEKPAFQILEYAEVPDQKSKPSRGKLCIVVTFLAAFISIFIAFVSETLSKIKKDSALVSKFKKDKK